MLTRWRRKSNFRWVGLKCKNVMCVCVVCACVCMCVCVYVVYLMVRQQISSEQADLSQAGGIRGKKKVENL